MRDDGRDMSAIMIRDEGHEATKHTRYGINMGPDKVRRMSRLVSSLEGLRHSTQACISTLPTSMGLCEALTSIARKSAVRAQSFDDHCWTHDE